MLPNLSPAPTLPAELLYVDGDVAAARYLPLLRESYRVTHVSLVSAAVQHLKRSAPALIVTEVSLPDGSGAEICRQGKRLATPATVLATTADVDRVPDMLAAGCDAVLLKPFAPNLLCARLGRLGRARSEQGRRPWPPGTPDAQPAADQFASGTNRVWPDARCPECGHAGITGFEFASHRRAWYACIACEKVWLGKRLE